VVARDGIELDVLPVRDFGHDQHAGGVVDPGDTSCPA
jgi:hypothetical protein